MWTWLLTSSSFICTLYNPSYHSSLSSPMFIPPALLSRCIFRFIEPMWDDIERSQHDVDLWHLLTPCHPRTSPKKMIGLDRMCISFAIVGHKKQRQRLSRNIPPTNRIIIVVLVVVVCNWDLETRIRRIRILEGGSGQNFWFFIILAHLACAKSDTLSSHSLPHLNLRIKVTTSYINHNQPNPNQYHWWIRY